MLELDAGPCAADGTLVVELAGELELASAERFERALGELAEHSRLVLDLRGLEFIDSSGVRCLICAQDQARRAGRELVVVRPASASAGRVFEILALDRTDWVVDELPAFESGAYGL